MTLICGLDGKLTPGEVGVGLISESGVVDKVMD